MNKINRIEKIDYQTLYNFVCIEKKTTKQISEILKVSEYSVCYYKTKYGIRKGSIRLKVSEEEFKYLYIDKHLSIKDIADHFNISFITVINYAKVFGLKRNNGNDDSPYFEIVKSMYESGKSFSMISRELNLPKSRVRKIAIESGAKIRGKSESQQIFNYSYKEFEYKWEKYSNKFTKRCRRYFRSHVAPLIKKDCCELCGSNEKLHFHHLKSFSIILNEIINENEGLSEDDMFEVVIHDKRFLDLDNIKVVCEKCHYTVYHPYYGYKLVNQQPSLE